MSFWRIRTTGGSKEESGFLVAKRTQMLQVKFNRHQTLETIKEDLHSFSKNEKAFPQDAPGARRTK